jgi:DNA-directed RNA polymerase specialized sigma24 family protein
MELEAQIMRCNAIISDMPKGGGSRDWTDQVDRLIKRRDDALKAVRRYNDTAEAIEAQIAQVKPESLRILMEARYLNGWKWQKVADVMAYSLDNVYKMHGRALPQIQVPPKVSN